MTVSQIMNRFSKFGEGKIPVEELAEAARQKDAITPLLLKNLDDVFRKVQGKEYEEIDWDDPDFELFMYSCYLLSQFQEQRAFPKLMRFLTLDFAIMDAVFMESTIDQLCQFLYSTYNGDLEDAKGMRGIPKFTTISGKNSSVSCLRWSRMDAWTATSSGTACGSG